MTRSLLRILMVLTPLLVGPAGCSQASTENGPGGRDPGGNDPGALLPERPFLVVVNKSASTASAVDVRTHEERAVVSTGLSPHEVAVTSDGALAVVTDYGTGPQPGHTLTVVSLEEFEVVRTIDLSPHTRPHGIAAAADGTVWVTTEGSRHVLRVDPVEGRILQAVETGQQTTHQVALSEARDRVVTANIGSGNVTIVEGSTGTVLAHVATGAGAEGVDVHPDGRRVYVSNRAEGTLAEVDLETNALVRTLRVGDFPIRVKVTPDGREALVSNAQGSEVAAVDLEAWEVVRRLAVGAVPVGILITPDGRTAYVANTADDRLTVVDLGGWRVAETVAAGDEPDGMAWVP